MKGIRRKRNKRKMGKKFQRPESWHLNVFEVSFSQFPNLNMVVRYNSIGLCGLSANCCTRHYTLSAHAYSSWGNYAQSRGGVKWWSRSRWRRRGPGLCLQWKRLEAKALSTCQPLAFSLLDMPNGAIGYQRAKKLNFFAALTRRMSSKTVTCLNIYNILHHFIHTLHILIYYTYLYPGNWKLHETVKLPDTARWLQGNDTFGGLGPFFAQLRRGSCPGTSGDWGRGPRWERNTCSFSGEIWGYPKSCQIGRTETHGFGITYLKKSTKIVLRCFANC